MSTLVVAQRHLLLRQGVNLQSPLQLAHGRVQEARLTRLLMTTEGILIALLTPVLGLLIDLYGNVDRVLVLVGLCFLLALTLSALTSVLKSLKYRERSYSVRSTLGRSVPRTSRPAYSLLRLAW